MEALKRTQEILDEARRECAKGDITYISARMTGYIAGRMARLEKELERITEHERNRSDD